MPDLPPHLPPNARAGDPCWATTIAPYRRAGRAAPFDIWTLKSPKN